MNRSSPVRVLRSTVGSERAAADAWRSRRAAHAPGHALKNTRKHQDILSLVARHHLHVLRRGPARALLLTARRPTPAAPSAMQSAEGGVSCRRAPRCAGPPRPAAARPPPPRTRGGRATPPPLRSRRVTPSSAAQARASPTHTPSLVTSLVCYTFCVRVSRGRAQHVCLQELPFT